jgi:single-strand DNA-binding protein
MYLNKVQLIGNLTRDPEVRALPSGAKVASFSLATSRTWKDKDGSKKESTDFHNIVAFGQLADIIAQYSKKGSSMYVEGRIQNRSWDGPDGQKKYRTEIVLENFQFGPKSSGGSSETSSSSSAGGKEKSPSAEEIDTIEYPAEEASEDIPF